MLLDTRYLQDTRAGADTVSCDQSKVVKFPDSSKCSSGPSVPAGAWCMAWWPGPGYDGMLGLLPALQEDAATCCNLLHYSETEVWKAGEQSQAIVSINDTHNWSAARKITQLTLLAGE